MSTLREAAEKAIIAIDALTAVGSATKVALDKPIPNGEPVHPLSAGLTWPLAVAKGAADALRAALAKPDAGWAAELSKRLKFLKIVTDSTTLRQIEVLAAGIAAPAPQPAGGEREAFAYWQEAHRLSDALRRHLSTIPAPTQPAAQQEPTGDFADALAAVDSTLHGAIDHWQERALKAEAALAQAGQGEPVAWQRRDMNIVTGVWGDWEHDRWPDEPLDPKRAERRPLFAHPPAAKPLSPPSDPLALALNTMHKDCHKAADAFWAYWNENGETHKHGYYESTWGAINRALRTVGVVPWNPPATKQKEES